MEQLFSGTSLAAAAFCKFIAQPMLVLQLLWMLKLILLWMPKLTLLWIPNECGCYYAKTFVQR